MWRVDKLPSEAYYTWIYAPFIKLVSPTGSVVAQLDGAISMEGWEWRLNHIVISDAVIPLPPNLPTGSYRAVATLFDPNQHKNAVYFDKSTPDKYFLELGQTVEITK